MFVCRADSVIDKTNLRNKNGFLKTVIKVTVN